MTMGLERFQELIDAYGAEPSRWPLAERAGAEALLANDAQARALVADAAALDALLDAAEAAPEPSDLLRHRVLRAAPRARAAISRFGWASGAGWAAAAAAGVLVGVSVGHQMSLTWQADAVLEQATAWSADETEYFG
jgi:hypothetical protein